MTVIVQLKAAQQLAAQSLRVAWADKWLWRYSAVLFGIFVFLFGVGAFAAHFVSTAGSWYLWFAPKVQVPVSISEATIKMFFIALVAFIGVFLTAVITYQLVNRFNGVALSFVDSFKLEPRLWRPVLCWAIVFTVIAVIFNAPFAEHFLTWRVFRILAMQVFSLISMFVMPALIKDRLSVWPAFVRCTVLVWHFLALVVWAFILYVLFISLVCFAVFASAMVIAKVLGLLFGWSAFVTLVPFAIIGGGFFLAVMLYLFVALSVFALRTYAYLTMSF